MAEPTNDPKPRFGDESRLAPDDARLSFPAAERNLAPIRDALVARFGGLGGRALEIGSGTGQHLAAFARALPGLDWIGSDPEPAHRASIAAWAAHEGLDLPAPLDLDASGDWWTHPEVAARTPLALIFCANVIHISPPEVATGLFAGAGRVLAPGGVLVLYGPFRVAGDWIAESNRVFDARLRAQDPRWGIRDTEELRPLAEAAGLSGPDLVEMPANNRLCIWTRR